MEVRDSHSARLGMNSEKQATKFKVLYELAIAMTADRHLEENLQLVVDRSRDLLDTDTSFIALRDESSDEVYMHTISGIRTASFKEIRLPLGKGLGGLVALTKRGRIIDDYLSDKNVAGVVDNVVIEEQLVSGMAVPILMGHRNLGVLYVFNRKPTVFTQSDLDTLSLVGNLAAVEIARSQTEESLRQSEEKYRSVMEASGEPIVVYDEDGRVVYLNPAFTRVFGWTLEELLGEKTPYVPEENWPETNIGIREVLTNPQGFYSYESRRYNKNGEILDVIISASAYRDRDGLYQGMIANLRDITARKHAEQALRESEEKYRSVMEASGEPIVVYDTEGRVVYLNPAFSRVFGWSLEEVFGKQTPYVPAENRPETDTAIKDVFKAPEGYYGFESRRYTKSGEIIDVMISASAYRDADGNPLGMIVNLKDITARKRAEEALALSENQLRLLSSQLLTAQETERKRIAQELHDGIGQSLTAVKYGLESVVQQVGTGKAAPTVETLQALILLVQTAIDDVARMSMDLRPSTLDDLGILTTLTWFCREFQRIYSGIHIEKETSLDEAEVPEDLKIVIFRVVQEAFNNIAKYSKCKVAHLSLRKRAGSVELAIRDDGVGFDLDPAFSAKSYGKGFGLPSMRERVQLSGGWFSIDSRIGSGTTIVAAWPQRISGASRK